jgi:hypothetical protein
MQNKNLVLLYQNLTKVSEEEKHGKQQGKSVRLFYLPMQLVK